MIMLRRIIDLKGDCYLWIEGFDIERGEIAFRIEDQAIDAGSQIILNQKEWFHPAILIGPGVSYLHPALVRVLKFERDGDFAGGPAARCIEDEIGRASCRERV